MSQNEFLMPSMGEGIEEATLVKWLKAPGETVNEDEPLLEVSTDKVDTEIASPYSGTLIAVHASEGDVVLIDSVIAVIGDEKTNSQANASLKAATSNKEPSPTPLSPVNTSISNTARATDLHRSSPLVRKMAKDHGVDLSQLTGTGISGRITKKDLLSYLDSPTSQDAPQVPAVDAVPTPSACVQSQTTDKAEDSYQSLKTSIIDGHECVDGVPVRRETMSKMRQIISSRMVSSLKTSPHVTTVFEVDMLKVWDIRENEKAGFMDREGFKLTFTPFLIHAATSAIKAHPIVNVSVDGSDILWKKDINVGCAVALNGGLIVPVIKRADELTLLGISRRLNELVQNARKNALSAADVQGGTFTITNPGGYGSIVSAPIINQPQVAILGIGAIVKRPVVVDDMIAVRPVMQISLTFDHRVIDGEAGAKYLATLKNILENYSDLPH